MTIIRQALLTIFLSMCILGILLFNTNGHCLVYADSAQAVISSIEGSVLIQAAGKATALPAKQGMAVKKGDRIITGKDGKVELRFTDGSVSRISPSSRIDISQLTSSAEGDTTVLDANWGKVWNKVQDVSKQNSRFEVNTPSAVAGVRGTGFAVEVGRGQDNTSETIVRVYDGRVGVQGHGAGAAGGETLVSPFQQATASGSAPAPQAQPLDVLAVDSWERDNLAEDVPVAYVEVEVETKVALETQINQQLQQERVELLLLAAELEELIKLQQAAEQEKQAELAQLVNQAKQEMELRRDVLRAAEHERSQLAQERQNLEQVRETIRQAPPGVSPRELERQAREQVREVRHAERVKEQERQERQNLIQEKQQQAVQTKQELVRQAEVAGLRSQLEQARQQVPQQLIEEVKNIQSMQQLEEKIGTVSPAAQEILIAPSQDQRVPASISPWSGSEPIQAPSVDSGSDDGDTSQLAPIYTSAPRANPPAGNYWFGGMNVQLYTSTPGAQIYYSIGNDSDPINNGILYTGPIEELNDDTVIKAVSRLNSENSTIAAFDYVFRKIFLNSISASAGQTITITGKDLPTTGWNVSAKIGTSTGGEIHQTDNWAPSWNMENVTVVNSTTITARIPNSVPLGTYAMQVKFVNSANTQEFAAATSLNIITVAPKAITGVGVSGSTTTGENLTAVVSPSEATVNYQWQYSTAADGTFINITDATSESYTLTTLDVDRYIRVVVTGYEAYAGIATSVPVGPVNLGEPVVITSSPASVPAAPTGWKKSTPFGLSSPVYGIVWGEYTYWPYDDISNNHHLKIIAYNGQGVKVKEWDYPSSIRYIENIVVDTNSITFYGQSGSSLPIARSVLLISHNNINIAPVTGGTAAVTTDPAVAAIAGETVTVTISDIEPGKMVELIRVLDEDLQLITLQTVTLGQEYTFTMPAKAVTVHVELAVDP